MPTYEYRCGACGHAFEKFQKISDDPVRVCPECGEERAERIISSGAGLIFKGPGFYATDYGKKGEAGGEEGSSADGGGAGSDEESGGTEGGGTADG